MDHEKVQHLIRQLLVEIGEDPRREGLLDTPKRVAQAFEFLTGGYRVDMDKLINEAMFKQETTSMVIERDIELYSLCEHHLLPFYGRCHIGYIPAGQGLRHQQAGAPRGHVLAAGSRSRNG